MKFVKLLQGSEEWKLYRRTRIGASDCPAIIGCDPYKKAASVWDEKVSGKEQFVSGAMKRGLSLEEIVRGNAIEWFGKHFSPAVIEHLSIPYMFASVDGISADGQILEIKCPNASVVEGVRLGIIPEHYIWQMQHQMEVVGAQKNHLIVYDGSSMVHHVVDRDQSMIDQLLEKECEFYDMMKNQIRPGTSLEAITDDEVVKLVESYSEAKERAKEAKEREEQLKEQIISYGGGSPFRCAGYSIDWVSGRQTVDYKSIPQLKGMDLAPYTKSSEGFWKISSSKRA